MPPKPSYADRVYTTDVVAYPGTVHVGNDKNFTPVIEKALELGGYTPNQEFTGINGGHTVTTGFVHDTILGVADQVINAVKSGAIRHFFLVAGCDGAAMPMVRSRLQWLWQKPSIVVSMNCHCPWCCPGMSRKRSASC